MPSPSFGHSSEISRLTQPLLRKAGEPSPTRELIRRSMEARGLNVADKGPYELAREPIRADQRR